MAKRTVIHVNKHVLTKNRKTGEREPPLTCKSYDANRKGNSVVIRDDNGVEVAVVRYSPDKPLNCGAVCWIETHLNVEVLP